MDDVLQAHGRLLRNPTIQFRFPVPVSVPAPELPVGGGWSFAPGPAMFWTVTAVVLAVLAVVGVQAFRTRVPRQARASGPGGQGAVSVPAGASVAVLADADALARAGAYGDAVHALLLRGVGAIQRRFPRALAPAHTARDIAKLAVLPPALAHAFGGIAAHSERAVFAQLPLGIEDWTTCRALYAACLDEAAIPPGRVP